MEKPRFNPKIPAFLKCPICFMLFVNPSRINCGHTFCLACIRTWTKKQSPAACPICREPVLNPSSDLIANHIINNWKVICAYEGCIWTGKYEDYEKHKHILNTEKEVINCSSNEIKEMFKRIDDLILRKEPIDRFIGEQIEKGRNSIVINELILTYQNKICKKREVEPSLPSISKKK